MYKYLNVHPKGKHVGDCVKRAITLATEKDYKVVSKELNTLKRELGEDKFNSNKVWKEYVKRNHFVKLSFPAKVGQPRMNGERFCKAYPKGRYILRMASHLSCCVDGVIYDIWDCSEKCVYNAWKVK